MISASDRHLLNLTSKPLQVPNVPGAGFVGGLLSPGAVIRTNYFMLHTITSRVFADHAAREIANLISSGQLTVITPGEVSV